MDIEHIADTLINGIMNELEVALNQFENGKEERALKTLGKIVSDLDDAKIYLSRQNKRETDESISYLLE